MTSDSGSLLIILGCLCFLEIELPLFVLPRGGAARCFWVYRQKSAFNIKFRLALISKMFSFFTPRANIQWFSFSCCLKTVSFRVAKLPTVKTKSFGRMKLQSSKGFIKGLGLHCKGFFQFISQQILGFCKLLPQSICLNLSNMLGSI